MYRSLLILALCGVAFAQEPLTDAQRAEYFKIQAKMLGAASNLNLTQLKIRDAQADAEGAIKAFTAAKAEFEAYQKTICKEGELDTSTDEPKCKAKVEDPKTKEAVPEPHAGGNSK